MNEQMLEQSEEVLMVEVSDEALEAAAGNGLGGLITLTLCDLSIGNQCR